MNVIEKLKVMLPHWIEHNRGHAEEFAQWAEQLDATEDELAGQLHRAVHSLEEAQRALEEALVSAGGALSSEKEDNGGSAQEQHHHH